MTVTELPPIGAAQPAGLDRRRRLAADSVYVLLGFPLSLTAFVLLAVGLALGAGLAVVWVGLPVLAATLAVARRLAALERARMRTVLAHPLAEPVYPVAGRDATLAARVMTTLREPQYWLDIAHGLVHVVVSAVTFSVVLAWWAGVVGGLGYAAYGWALPEGPDDQDLPELLGLGDRLVVRVVFYLVLGLLFAATVERVTRAMAVLEASLGRVLLTGRAGTRAELGRLAQGRDSAVAAEAVALRQLERDIHDGPQQRLVRLSMDLHRAHRLVEVDPAGARATLLEAAEQTRETLEELRALSRGIAPPVLADRGITAALVAVAARSPVPVELAVGLPLGQRLAPAVENTAYFLVSEALANTAKHSGAALATVTVDLVDGCLQVDVVDNGSGGAVLAPGHGLAGLTDRLRAVDGTLTVTSPPGGPTSVCGVIPCP